MKGSLPVPEGATSIYGQEAGQLLLVQHLNKSYPGSKRKSGKNLVRIDGDKHQNSWSVFNLASSSACYFIPLLHFHAFFLLSFCMFASLAFLFFDLLST
jgi:hypothetical protein